MTCSKNGIKQEGSSCSLNNNCIYPECMKRVKDIILTILDLSRNEKIDSTSKSIYIDFGKFLIQKFDFLSTIDEEKEFKQFCDYSLVIPSNNDL